MPRKLRPFNPSQVNLATMQTRRRNLIADIEAENRKIDYYNKNLKPEDKPDIPLIEVPTFEPLYPELVASAKAAVILLSQAAEWDDGDTVEVLQWLDAERIQCTDDIGTVCEQCLGLLRYADSNPDSTQLQEAAETLKQWFDMVSGD